MKLIIMTSAAIISVGLICIAAFQLGRLFVLEVAGIVHEAWHSPDINS
jgi:hypothetical protein